MSLPPEPPSQFPSHPTPPGCHWWVSSLVPRGMWVSRALRRRGEGFSPAFLPWEMETRKEEQAERPGDAESLRVGFLAVRPQVSHMIPVRLHPWTDKMQAMTRRWDCVCSAPCLVQSMGWTSVSTSFRFDLGYPSSSQLGQIVHPENIWQRLKTLWVVRLQSGRCYMDQSSGWRPGTLFSILWCKGCPPQQRMIWPQMSAVPRLRHPDLPWVWKRPLGHACRHPGGS